MKISVIYGLFLVAVTLHLPCEAKELSNLDNSSSNNELKQLLAGKRYKRRLKSTRTARPKKKLLDKPVTPKKKGIKTYIT